MQRWPWITLVVTAVLALNPIGYDFIHGAFFSGEQLARNIAQPFVYAAVVILLALGVLEWWARRRRMMRGGA